MSDISRITSVEHTIRIFYHLFLRRPFLLLSIGLEKQSVLESLCISRCPRIGKGEMVARVVMVNLF